MTSNTLPVIQSALDNDLYKFTMMQAAWHQFRGTFVTYRFKCRSNVTISKPQKAKLIQQLSDNIETLRSLTFTFEDIDVLRGLKHFKEDYLFYMLGRAVLPSEVDIKLEEDEDGLLKLSYSGTWQDTILAEVPLMAIISELGLEIISSPYRESNFAAVLQKAINERLDFAKAHPHFRFADFGTRRRYSFAHQENSIKAFVDAANNHETYALIGTSNVYFAHKYNIKAIGTHAHEWFMAMQAKTNLKNFQRFALQAWANEYRGDLGIALSDCVGMDYFLKDFDKYFSKLFDGCRHDSGDPRIWCNKLIAHYKKMGIDETTKTAVFSDGLTFKTGYALQEDYKGKIKTSLGIGTYFTNNVADNVQPISMVIKMTECDGQPVTKSPDSSGKGMCENPNYVALIDYLFKNKEITAEAA